MSSVPLLLLMMVVLAFHYMEQKALNAAAHQRMQTFKVGFGVFCVLVIGGTYVWISVLESTPDQSPVAEMIPLDVSRVREHQLYPESTLQKVEKSNDEFSSPSGSMPAQFLVLVLIFSCAGTVIGQIATNKVRQSWFLNKRSARHDQCILLPPIWSDRQAGHERIGKSVQTDMLGQHRESQTSPFLFKNKNKHHGKVTWIGKANAFDGKSSHKREMFGIHSSSDHPWLNRVPASRTRPDLKKIPRPLGRTRSLRSDKENAQKILSGWENSQHEIDGKNIVYSTCDSIESDVSEPSKETETQSSIVGLSLPSSQTIDPQYLSCKIRFHEDKPLISQIDIERELREKKYNKRSNTDQHKFRRLTHNRHWDKKTLPRIAKNEPRFGKYSRHRKRPKINSSAMSAGVNIQQYPYNYNEATVLEQGPNSQKKFLHTRTLGTTSAKKEYHQDDTVLARYLSSSASSLLPFNSDEQPRKTSPMNPRRDESNQADL